jgi:hypothetical protein
VFWPHYRERSPDVPNARRENLAPVDLLVRRPTATYSRRALFSGGLSQTKSQILLVPTATLIGKLSSIRRACGNETVRSSFNSTE